MESKMTFPFQEEFDEHLAKMEVRNRIFLNGELLSKDWAPTLTVFYEKIVDLMRWQHSQSQAQIVALKKDLLIVQDSHKRQCDLNDRAHEKLKLAVEALERYEGTQLWVGVTTGYGESTRHSQRYVARETLEKLREKV